MAWTSPITFVAGAVLTAAQMNTYLRDNMLEDAVAKATTAGGYFVATGTGAIAQRVVTNNYDSSVDTTTSTTYTDLSGGASPAVTSTTGTSAIVFLSCSMQHNTVGGLCAMGFAVSGATTIAENDGYAVRHTSATVSANLTGSWVGPQTLTAGSNTFTARYKVTAGTGTFSVRRIMVLPL